MSARNKSWRVQSDHTGGFDELVCRVGTGVVHAEVMDADASGIKSLFLAIPGVCFWISRHGKKTIVTCEFRPQDDVRVGKSDAIGTIAWLAKTLPRVPGFSASVRFARSSAKKKAKRERRDARELRAAVRRVKGK